MKTDNPSNLNNDLYCVDIFKYIASIFVIVIHVGAFSNKSNITGEYLCILQWIIRTAVPFFFITSGYLTERKLQKLQRREDKSRYVFHRSAKFFKLFIIWLLIYLPITIVYDILNNISFHNAIYDYITSVIFSGESVSAWPLWYLYASGFSLLILASLSKYKHYLIIYLSIFVFVYIINIFTTDFHTGVFYYIHRICDRPLGGGIYLAFGMILYKGSSFINKYIIILLLALSFLFKVYDLESFEIWGGIAFFIMALRIKLKPNDIYLKLRIQSIWIYYIHMYVLVFIMSFVFMKGLQLSIYFVLSISISASIILSYLIYKLSEIKRFRFLNNLIS